MTIVSQTREELLPDYIELFRIMRPHRSIAAKARAVSDALEPFRINSAKPTDAGVDEASRVARAIAPVVLPYVEGYEEVPPDHIWSRPRYEWLGLAMVKIANAAIAALSTPPSSEDISDTLIERKIVAWLRKEADEIFVEGDLPLTTAASYMHAAATAIERGDHLAAMGE